jgi:hypothetical protein
MQTGPIVWALYSLYVYVCVYIETASPMISYSRAKIKTVFHTVIKGYKQQGIYINVNSMAEMTYASESEEGKGIK